MDHTLSQPFGQPSRPRWHWWSMVLLVISIALGLRLYYVTHAVVFQPVNIPGAKGNAAQYYNYAHNLVQHGVFSADPIGTLQPVGDSFRDPGYPVFLAAWMEVFPQWNAWYAAVIFSQAILSAAVVGLWLIVGRRWLPPNWALAAGLLMAVWPHSIVMSSHLLSETLYGFLISLVVFIFVLGLDKPTTRWAAISGICFSLAAFTNSVALPFATILSIYMVIKGRIPAKVALILVATTICLATPWMIRNSMQRADQPTSTDRALTNLVQGSWPLYHSADMAVINNHDPQAARVMAQIDTEIAVIETNRQQGLAMMWQRMSKNPAHYMFWYLTKPALLWDWRIRIGVRDIYMHNTYHSPFDFNPIWRAAEAACQTINMPLAALALIGCLFALRLSTPAAEDTTALLLLFVTIVHSLLQAEPRYSIPYRGAEILLAVSTAYRISAHVHDLQTRAREKTASIC